ncbi:MAG: choice-of-anchor tandem repeat GloVer-containing protein [Candidatus Tumulicola sp.]
MTETVLHSFGIRGGPDGSAPVAGLTAVGGTLYGTTIYGGDRNMGDVGTVFSITTSGTYTQLYIFSHAHTRNGGGYPWAGLTNLNGTLYGATTGFGGGGGEGTIFKVTTSNKITLYRFMTAPDGSQPSADLTNVGGTLYGTTIFGGASTFGTVFAVTQSGRYRQLYSFTDANDGCPVASLTNVSGVLYGTTSGCRKNNDGTVFKITTAGTERVLHRFTGGGDGAVPEAGLTNVGGTLYGTTSAGGGTGCGGKGCGTVFKITTAGTETVLYSFKGGRDGALPLAELTNVRGMLYGTTYWGGSSNNQGTVFKVTTLGKQTVLYRFAGEPDGESPYGGVVDVDGLLYGTTVNGGVNGNGTIFSLSGF